MPVLIVFCGPAGAGKTTLSKQVSENNQITRYSFDEMECFEYSELFPHIIQSLSNKESVVVDALFTRLTQRKRLLEAIKNIDCKRILIMMNTPLDECIRRNAQRPKPLPQFIVRDICNSIEPPTLDEGWDEIIYVEV